MKTKTYEYFVWITEYPDDGSILISGARDARDAKKLAIEAFGEPISRLSAKRATHKQILTWNDDNESYV